MRAVLYLFHETFLSFTFHVVFSYYASTLFPQATPQPRAVKRQRLMTPVQARPTAIIASPSTQVVLQPQQQQQIVASNNLTTAAANTLLQLQQQQQQILLANGGSLVNLCNSKQNQPFVNGSSNKSCNGDNNENVNQQNSIAGPFKVYSEFYSCDKIIYRGKIF
jgi:hypothetical protein